MRWQPAGTVRPGVAPRAATAWIVPPRPRVPTYSWEVEAWATPECCRSCGSGRACGSRCSTCGRKVSGGAGTPAHLCHLPTYATDSPFFLSNLSTLRCLRPQPTCPLRHLSTCAICALAHLRQLPTWTLAPCCKPGECDYWGLTVTLSLRLFPSTLRLWLRPQSSLPTSLSPSGAQGPRQSRFQLHLNSC